MSNLRNRIMQAERSAALKARRESEVFGAGGTIESQRAVLARELLRVAARPGCPDDVKIRFAKSAVQLVPAGPGLPDDLKSRCEQVAASVEGILAIQGPPRTKWS